MSEKDEPRGTASAVTRRQFIQITTAAASSALTSGIASGQGAKDGSARSDMPVVAIADVSTLKVDTPLAFSYPDKNAPAVLLRLKGPAIGGVGPGNSIVAYSSLCTHKGCPVAYKPQRGLLICPCHWSSFDPAKSGEMVIGQGSQALPRIALRMRGNTVEAFGIEGLIYGRHTNVL